MKSKYITPEITVVEFKVEAGFADSAPQKAFGLNNGIFSESQNEVGEGGGYQATQMGGDYNTDYENIF